MKEADNLYKYAEESGLKYSDLLDKIHNFLVGSLEQDPYLNGPDNLELMGIDKSKMQIDKFKVEGPGMKLGRRANSIGVVSRHSIGVAATNPVAVPRANSIGMRSGGSRGRVASKESINSRGRDVVEGRSKSGAKFRIKR